MRSTRLSILRGGSCRISALSFESAATNDPGDHWASHFDGVQIGAVGWQVEDVRPPLGNGLADACNLVGREVVKHHDIAAFQGGREDMADIGTKGGSIHRAIEHPARCHAGQAQTCNERRRLPMAKWRAVAAAFAHRSPAIEPGHLRVDTCLIQKNQALRSNERLRRPPQLAPCRDVGPILFAGAQGFF
jgi:hypothetical protein